MSLTSSKSKTSGSGRLPVLDQARRVVAAGISVIPIATNGTKRPAGWLLPEKIDPKTGEVVLTDEGKPEHTWTPFQEHLPTDEDLQAWFGVVRPAGIATVSGKISGNLELLDFDRRADEVLPEWMEMVEAEAPGLLNKLNTVRTPRTPEGYHVRYRCPGVVLPGNTPVAREEVLDEKTGKPKLVVLIETRGEGGYAVAPGSPLSCHETGRPYEYLSGPELWELQPITPEERSVLWRCARAFDRIPPEEPSPRRKAAKGGTAQAGDWPGDDFNRRTTLRDLLEEAGWKVVRQRGDVLLWRRPGKEGKTWSATSGRCRSKDNRDFFYVFSTSASPFEAGKWYDAFDVYAVLSHEGDLKAAAQDLYKQGFGARMSGAKTAQGAAAGAGSGTPPPKPPGGGGGGNDQPEEEPQPLELLTASEIKIKPVKWLVPKRIPLGKLSLFAGRGGLGKSFCCLDTAARLSRGEPCMGLDYTPDGPCDTIYISCEDDPEDTLVPRLVAAGADLSRVHFVKGIRQKNGKPAPFSMAHFRELERTLSERKAVRFVVVDPAGAFISRAGINDNKEAELRSLLDPLAEVAASQDVAVHLVKHLNKSAGASAIDRVAGSAAYVNTVRAALVFGEHPEDPNQLVLSPLKANNARAGGLVCRLAPLPTEDVRRVIREHASHLDTKDQALLEEQLYRVVWDGETDLTAEDCFARRKASGSGEKATQPQEVAEWLVRHMDGKAWPSDELQKAALAAGYSFDAYRRAKEEVLNRCHGYQAKKFGETWWYGRGPVLEWIRRPAPNGAPP